MRRQPTAVSRRQSRGEEVFLWRGANAPLAIWCTAREKPIGPDLSNVARELTVDQIRQALLQPSAQIAPGYSLVTFACAMEARLRGFARNRTRFDIQVQDLKGEFHPVSLDRVAAVEEEKQSLMPPAKADPRELQNLIAYLSSLSGIRSGTSPVSRATSEGGIDFSRILNPKPGDWPTYNGNLSGNRYSELKQIKPRQREQTGLALEFLGPTVGAVLPGYAVLPREHAVLRIGDGSPGRRRHHVCDRAGPGVRARRAERPSHLAVFPSAHSGHCLRCLAGHEPRLGPPGRQAFHDDRQRPPDRAAPRHRPALVGSRHAGRTSALRRHGGAA